MGSASFILDVSLGGAPAARRVLHPGDHTCGRSPSCDVILPDLDVDVVAQLLLSADGSMSVRSFVADLDLRRDGSSGRESGAERLPIGAVRAFGPGSSLSRRNLVLRIAARRDEPLLPPEEAEAGTQALASDPTAASTTRWASEGSGSPGVPPSKTGLPRLPLVLCGLATLLAVLAWGLADGPPPTDPIAPAQALSSTAEADLRLAIASADILSPVEVTVSEQGLRLAGEVTDSERERLATIAEAVQARRKIAIALDLTTTRSAVRESIAAVLLAPELAVFGKDGSVYRIGDTLPEGWRVDAIDPAGIRVQRGSVVETVALETGG